MALASVGFDRARTGCYSRRAWQFPDTLHHRTAQLTTTFFAAPQRPESGEVHPVASSGSSNDRTDYKAQVLAATDIVQLIGQSVALKRRGKDYVGLCPFHSEKTPSFKVSPARQAFYCFGCKASGNAIDFVIKRDRVEFIDALR